MNIIGKCTPQRNACAVGIKEEERSSKRESDVERDSKR